MCTIGVRRFGDDEYVLFKNKDFARNHFEDRLVVERGLFGVVGLSLGHKPIRGWIGTRGCRWEQTMPVCCVATPTSRC